MNGALLLTGGEACPAVVPAPFSLGPDLTSNAVVAAGFRLPPHQFHAPRCTQKRVALHTSVESLVQLQSHCLDIGVHHCEPVLH